MKIIRINLCYLVLASALIFMLNGCQKENLTEPEYLESENLDIRAIKSALTVDLNAEKYEAADDLSLLTKIKGNNNKLKIMFAEGFDKSRLLRGGENQGKQIEIPDANFEQALIDLEVDTDLDGVVFKNNVKEITLLNVERKNISDLSGIEHFTELKNLNCNFNFLASLNISKNQELLELYCYENQLTSLDVSKNEELKILYCSGNELTNLNVTKNANLEELWVSSNQLTSLDVSKNTALRLLTCRAQPLTSLDVTNNTKLETLWVGPYSPLESLDVSQNGLLTSLAAYNCQLSDLNVQNGNNTNFTTFTASGNPDLNCIQVDNVAYSEAYWLGFNFRMNPCIEYSEDCSSFIPPTYCPTDLSGNHSYVSTNLQAESGTCPVDPVIGTVSFSKICGNSYSVSDLYFGMNDSPCWFDIPMPSLNEGFVLPSGDCNLLISGFRDIYGFNVTWNITGVSGPDLYISWENNLVDYGYLVNDSGDVVITRQDGVDWPPLYTN